MRPMTQAGVRFPPRYRLAAEQIAWAEKVGFDSAWVDTEAAHRMAAYTNLPPGDYTLHLRGSNRDGVWSESVLSVPIRVMPLSRRY